MGTDDLSPTGDAGKVVGIEDRIVHENHSDVSKHNDIALIKLNESVEFNNKIYPACLYSNFDGPEDSVDLKVTGFGKDHVLSEKVFFILNKK